MKRRTFMTLKTIDKSKLVEHEEYLVFANFVGDKSFVFAVYTGHNTFAQADEPDLKMEDVVHVFEKPSEILIRS